MRIKPIELELRGKTIKLYASRITPAPCNRCLCESCNRVHCPLPEWRRLFFVCQRMQRRKLCPKLECDFYRNKRKTKMYRVVRRTKKVDALLARLAAIEAKLDKLAKQ